MHERLSRWWAERSLRTKITGVMVAVVTLGLMVIGIGSVVSIERYLISEIDTKISSASESLADVLGINDFNSFDRVGQGGLSNEFFLAAVSASGTTLASNLADDHEDWGPDVTRLGLGAVSVAREPLTVDSINGETTWRVMTYRLNVVSASGEQTLPASLVIGVDLAESRRIVGSFASVFLAFSLVVVLLSAALTGLLITSTFRH